MYIYGEGSRASPTKNHNKTAELHLTGTCEISRRKMARHTTTNGTVLSAATVNEF
jgi:hypothetical protein